MVNIDHDKIEIGVFDETVEYKDSEIPDTSKLAHLIIDNEGNIDIHAAKNITLKIEGDSKIEVSGNVEVSTDGDAKITASGSCTIDSPDVKITGGKLTTQGTGSTDMNGPFCGLKACVFSGAAHCGSITSGT